MDQTRLAQVESIKAFRGIEMNRVTYSHYQKKLNVYTPSYAFWISRNLFAAVSRVG